MSLRRTPSERGNERGNHEPSRLDASHGGAPLKARRGKKQAGAGTKAQKSKRKDGVKKSRAVERRLVRLASIATEVFQEFGYDATTLELIAKRAEISRQTIYNHFPTKEALFARIVDGVMNQIIETVDMVDDPNASAESQLIRYCEAIAIEMITPERIGSSRLMMDVARRHLLREFKISTNQTIMGSLVVHLDDMVRRGKLSIPDTRQAVYILFGISMLPSHRVLVGIAKKGTLEPELRSAIREGVRMFCKYYAPAAKPATRRRVARLCPILPRIFAT